MFPLGSVLFPHSLLALRVFEPRYQALTADSLAADRTFGVVLIARGREVGGGDERFDVGTVARILGGAEIGGGHLALQTGGIERIRVVEWLPDDPYPKAVVEPFPAVPLAQGDARFVRAEAAVRRARALRTELGDGFVLPRELPLDVAPEMVAWRLCELAPLEMWDRQRLLEVVDDAERLDLLVRMTDELCELLAAMLGGA
jgi:uncharacterized protein